MQRDIARQSLKTASAAGGSLEQKLIMPLSSTPSERNVLEPDQKAR